MAFSDFSLVFIVDFSVCVCGGGGDSNKASHTFCGDYRTGKASQKSACETCYGPSEWKIVLKTQNDSISNLSSIPIKLSIFKLIFRCFGVFSSLQSTYCIDYGVCTSIYVV